MIFTKLSDLLCAPPIRFDGIGYTTSAVVRKGSISIPLSFNGRLESVAVRPVKGALSILMFGLRSRGFMVRRNFN